MNCLPRPCTGFYVFLLCGIILLSCNRAWAQPAGAPDIEGRIITDIQVLGNQRVGSSTILAKVRSRRGQPYRAATINEDIKTVQRLRGIRTVYVSTKTGPDQLLVIFQVVEEPVVVLVELRGNRHFSDEDLRKLLRVYEGDFADGFLLARGREDIAAHYRQVGFHRVQVTAETDLLAGQGLVVYQITEGPRTRVRKVIFEGNRQVSSRKLRSKIRTKPYSFIFSAGVFDEQLIKDDVTELRLYLREKGYLDAQVARWYDFSPDQKWATVVFNISEGPLYKIRQVRFEGLDKFSSQELLELLKVGPGDVPVSSAVNTTNPQRIVQAYGRQGYIDAQINVRRVYVQDQPGLVDFVYDIVEGRQVRVGRIDIYGNKITQDRVIRRQLLLSPTDIYDTSRMQRSRQRLLESTLFSQVDISNAPGSDPVRDVKIDLAERDTAFLMMGVGVTSDAGVIGDFSFVQRNFDLFDFPTFHGAGQYLRLQAQPGTELMRFAIDFKEPYVADLPISFGQSIYLRGRFREDYDEDRLGALWSLGLRFEDGWEIEGAVRLEKVTIDFTDDETAQKIKEAQGSHNLTSVQGTIIRDKTDSVFLPSRGDIFEISYEQTGVFGGEYDFGRLEARYACYFTLHTDALDRKGVLALRVRGGSIIGDAPFFERYYAGGLGSIRGFDFRGVSPRDFGTVAPPNPPWTTNSERVAVGGDWLILAGAEYSFPLVGEHLRGAAFVDSGTVEEGPYRVSVGLGLRMMIPNFAPLPLSADFAWPISQDIDDDTRVFSFSLAMPFR
ncbi:MAG: outer membrane protein assembly factor BamA [Actinobacteria bacterium]|nr:outer membrane protein assembly factor BamA [Actinomycetota bacterium]